MTFTLAERRAILSEMFELRGRYRAYQLGDSPGTDPVALTDRMNQLSERYRAGLPRLPLSRCPYCGAIATRSFDPYGLDGLWWDYDGAVRAISEAQCPHEFAFTGAVRLEREALDDAPHIVVSGPEVPYVVPRVLDGQPVKAVISSIAVGRSTAYPIFYFADPAPAIDRINDWGTQYYTFAAPDGTLRWGEYHDLERDYDFELAPWLDSGQVAYILPDDATLTLRTGSAGCPYLGLPGRRDIMRLQDGVCWSKASELTG